MSSEEDKPLQQESTNNYREDPPISKSKEFLNWFKSLSLDGSFELWGKVIGCYPQAFLISGLILCGFTVFMVNLRLKDNVRDGYTPRTSRSRHETDLYRQFLDSQGDPAMTTIIMLARDNGSMHRMEYLNEAVQQMVYISKNLSVSVNGKTVTYDNFCGHYCKANSVISYFLLALDEKMRTGTKSLKLNYPIADMRNMKVHLERNFFGVRTTNNDTITNIEYVQLISMSFLAEVKSAEDLDSLNAWEMAVYDYCTTYSQQKDSFIEMLVIGAEIVDTEMNKDGQRMTPYFLTGFVIMFCFVCLTVAGSSLYFDKLSWKTIIVAFSCAAVPILAITTTFGLCNLIGNRTNSLMLIMPFLIMGIGVNDSFLTVHAWLRQPKRSCASDKLGRVLQEVGPSITTTTLTNVVTFMIGWLTPTEEISIFCLGSALALGFAYIYTIIIFCPILYYCSDDETRSISTASGWRLKVKKLLKCFTHHYCRLLQSRMFAALLLCGAVVYWYFGAIGTISMSAKLDTGKILPKESPVRRPNRFVENFVWKEYYPVTIIVNSPINIANPSELQELNRMIDEFESMDTCRGKNFTMFWLRDYEVYFNEVATQDFDYDMDETFSDDRPFGFSKLSGFLGSPVYEHNKAFVKVDENEEIMVRKFSLIVVYENNTSWDNRISLMQEWRQIVDRYPHLNASVWNVNAMFVDQMLSLKTLTVQTCLWTLFCMIIVCTIFIQNPISVILATLSIASISLGVMGYLSFWSLDLDPVSLCAILISIGMAVDFVAHTTYHYQLSHRHTVRGDRDVTIPISSPYERLQNTITNIAWPMSQAGISTVICILPLVMLRNYIPLVFVKTITLVVIWGLFHGLVVLPTILSQVPTRFLVFNCYRAVTSWKEEQELIPLSQETTRT